MKHDVDIVKKAINGDEEAFEQLLYKERKPLYYKALSLVGKNDDALDAIQETAYSAFVAISTLKNPEYFSTWLFRILLRECYKLLRERDKVIPYEESELFNKVDLKVDKAIDTFTLSEALYNLNSAYQTSIILYYYHDLSIKDIAEVMDKPVGTVKTNLRRAKKILRNELERSYQLNEKAT
ncbi:sigma-70 family RNA polymerase sigma factor [Alkalicoccobacillus porphyridii]|uniref:Sigma-70 family RNA polymerase sigma factor n=1 Tax=Alkalicoccobacillus porphyridii TaxID=2597270 RepID=A0A554A2B8_9BACI|nr:sigma-70 family RNA polymerase sigma factor [Alkalicoccobacillus porphyridii]TSB47796.1 sigma-70 family RNA polymerase sigma factor [Alkalicoccobacillus porphyridii]